MTGRPAGIRLLTPDVGAAFALFDSFDRTRRRQMHVPLAADR
jgi:hypothetical protein